MNSTPQNIALNILLADDDSDDCFFFKKALNELPIETNLTIVHDGEELMNYLSDNSDKLPDLLFLDLSMPRKTGIECLSEIKENEKFKKLRVVVFTTSFVRDIDFEQSLINTLSSIGAEKYIRKPSDFEMLKKIISEELANSLSKTV